MTTATKLRTKLPVNWWMTEIEKNLSNFSTNARIMWTSNLRLLLFSNHSWKKKKDNKKKQKLCIYCSGVYKLAPIAGERIGAGTPPPNSDD